MKSEDLNYQNFRIWVADDDSSIAWVLEKALKKQGYQVEIFASGEAVLNALSISTNQQPDVLLTDIRMERVSGFDLTAVLSKENPDLPVIIMTAFGDLDSAVNAFKHGAYEYLTKPFDINDMLELVEKACAQKNIAPSEIPVNVDKRQPIIGDSPEIQEVFRIIGKLGGSEMTVLIRGESGTGKELIAAAIHQNSPRASAANIAINTAAIPAELLESELFGHEKGAFTGAYSRHIGRFEQANGGTLFLDEIGDMPPGLQTRLLRVLSEGRFYRVGGREEIVVNVRVIAATHQNLEELVSKGIFRADLFHRLNVIAIEVPPLRNRPADIPRLVQYFISQIGDEIGCESKQFSPDAMTALTQYSWPGNIRELQNVVKRLMVLGVSQTIHSNELPREIRHTEVTGQTLTWQKALAEVTKSKLDHGEKSIQAALVDEFDSVLIQAALSHSNGHRQQAAKLLGLGRNTLSRKIKRLNL